MWQRENDTDLILLENSAENQRYSEQHLAEGGSRGQGEEEVKWSEWNTTTRLRILIKSENTGKY